MEYNMFRDSFLIFIKYIQRQYKKNKDYLPHPLIRAFEIAVSQIEKMKVGEVSMGVSQDGNNNRVVNPYVVVLEKTDKGILVKEVSDLQIDKKVPVEAMIMIFRLQILLDRYEGDLTPLQATEILNTVLVKEPFVFIGDKLEERWIEARDYFTKQLEDGKIKFAPHLTVIEDFKKITYDMTWEQYPTGVRAIIGQIFASKLNVTPGKIVCTTPTTAPVPKFKVFEMAMNYLLGSIAEHLKPQSKEDK